MKHLGNHVAVLAFPFGCHGLSLFNLVQKLATDAPSTQFSFFSTEKSNKSLFDVAKAKLPENIKAYNVRDGVSENHVFSRNPIERVELFLRATPENFRTSIDLAVAETGQNFSCLVADAFMAPFSKAIATDLCVPWIGVWVPLPHSLSGLIYTDQIRAHFADDSNRDKTLEDIIPGLSQMRFSDLPHEVLSENDAQEETSFSHMLSQVKHDLPHASSLVINFYEELYSTPLLHDLQSKFKNVLNVGFFTLSMPPQPLPPSTTDSTGCLSWLDGQKAKSVAYICFGTVVNVPQNEIEQLANALEESGVPFLWSIRDELKDSFPTQFVERTSLQGKIVPWAPQVQVLGHPSVGVYVTHCGANSMYESLANGVPMICRPIFGDNQMNGRIIEEEWGIGVGVDGGVFTKDGVVKSLELILRHEKGDMIRRKVQQVQQLVFAAASPSGIAAQDFKTLLQNLS